MANRMRPEARRINVNSEKLGMLPEGEIPPIGTTLIIYHGARNRREEDLLIVDTVTITGIAEEAHNVYYWGSFVPVTQDDWGELNGIGLCLPVEAFSQEDFRLGYLGLESLRDKRFFRIGSGPESYIKGVEIVEGPETVDSAVVEI